jgi:hypothetical protein
MRHEKCAYNNEHRKSTVECDDNFVLRILCVLPLNTLGKQYNECSLKYVLMDRVKMGRCHTLESKMLVG